MFKGINPVESHSHQFSNPITLLLYNAEFDCVYSITVVILFYHAFSKSVFVLWVLILPMLSIQTNPATSLYNHNMKNKQKNPTVFLVWFLNVETPKFICFSLQLVSRVVRNFCLVLKMKPEIHRYSRNSWWTVWMFSWRKTAVVMKVIEPRRTGNMEAQLIKTKINLRNCNWFFSKGYLYNYQEQLWGISDDTLYQKWSEFFQNVPLIKSTEHSEVWIRLFQILLQNYERGGWVHVLSRTLKGI